MSQWSPLRSVSINHLLPSQIDSFLPRKFVAHRVTGVLEEVKDPMTMEFILEHYHADMHPMVCILSH